MRYHKGKQAESLESLPLTKVLLVRHSKDGENIWVKQGPDYIVFQNDALHFLPFESWGAIIHNSYSKTIDLKDFDPEREGIELHPDAWAEYVKDGVIDSSGSYLKRAE